jgi:hypothetical protein
MMKVDDSIPERIRSEIPDYDIGLRAQLGRAVAEERRKNASVSDQALADRLAKLQGYDNCDAWVEARRRLRTASPSFGLDE